MDRDEEETVQRPIPVDVQSLPAWVRAAVFLGVPSVIALFLVYVMTTQMSERVTKIEQQQLLMAQAIAQITKAQADRQADATDTRRHFDQGLARLERAVRQMCVAVATSAEDRRACLAVRGEQ